MIVLSACNNLLSFYKSLLHYIRRRQFQVDLWLNLSQGYRGSFSSNFNLSLTQFRHPQRSLIISLAALQFFSSLVIISTYSVPFLPGSFYSILSTTPSLPNIIHLSNSIIISQTECPNHINFLSSWIALTDFTPSSFLITTFHFLSILLAPSTFLSNFISAAPTPSHPIH